LQRRRRSVGQQHGVRLAFEAVVSPSPSITAMPPHEMFPPEFEAMVG
jgi:hypothetical protein